MPVTEDHDDEREREAANAHVDTIISKADLNRWGACADVIVDAAMEERDALIDLMSVGVDINEPSIDNLTLGQLEMLSSAALKLRKRIIKRLKDDHDIEALAAGE